MGLKEFDLARYVLEDLGADEFFVRVALGQWELSLDGGLQGPVVGTGGLPFTQANQGGDYTQVQLGFLGEQIGEGGGVECSEELVELSRGHCATGILNRGSGFLFEHAQGALAGGLEGFRAPVVGLPELKAELSPANNVSGSEVLDGLTDGVKDLLVGDTVKDHGTDLVADSDGQPGDEAGAAVGIGGVIGLLHRWFC